MLTITGLSKSYGARRAVDNISLTLRRGEVLALLGPNGAGKTTTVSMIAGQLRADAGSIELDGLGSPSAVQVRRHLGLAPQSLALYDDLSAEENLRFFASLQDLRGKALNAALDKALALAGLTARRNERIKGFSGGMKRRLNLAVAVLHEPALLLLDEPTAGVDPQSRNQLLEAVRSLADAGHAIIYSTHYMEEAQKLCDRICIMDEGRILADDKLDSLLARHAGDYSIEAVVNGEVKLLRSADPLQSLNALQAEGGLERFNVKAPDLEEVFLNLTGRQLRD